MKAITRLFFVSALALGLALFSHPAFAGGHGVFRSKTVIKSRGFHGGFRFRSRQVFVNRGFHGGFRFRGRHVLRSRGCRVGCRKFRSFRAGFVSRGCSTCFGGQVPFQGPVPIQNQMPMPMPVPMNSPGFGSPGPVPPIPMPLQPVSRISVGVGVQVSSGMVIPRPIPSL